MKIDKKLLKRYLKEEILKKINESKDYATKVASWVKEMEAAGMKKGEILDRLEQSHRHTIDSMDADQGFSADDRSTGDKELLDALEAEINKIRDNATGSMDIEENSLYFAKSATVDEAANSAAKVIFKSMGWDKTMSKEDIYEEYQELVNSLKEIISQIGT